MPGGRLNFWELSEITFEKPDFENFRGLSLAFEAGTTGGSLPTVFNAANELAVSLFLDRRIGYLTITDMIESAMRYHKTVAESGCGPDSGPQSGRHMSISKRSGL